MNCPDCGFVLSPFDKSCPRCATFANKGRHPPPLLSGPVRPETLAEEMAAIPEIRPAPPATSDFACSNCGKTLAGGTRYCPNCGLAFGQEVPASRGFVPIVATAKQAEQNHVSTVVAMWMLSVIAFVSVISDAVGLGLFLDFLALGMGFRLLSSPLPYDRWHGQAKLVLEFVAFVIAVMVKQH